MINKKQRTLFWVSIVGFVLIFLSIVSDILLPFVVGMLAAYFLSPLIDKLTRIGLSRTVATLLITVFFFCSGIIFAILLLPVLYDQFLALASNIPQYAAMLHSKYGDVISKLIAVIAPEAIDKVKDAAGGFSGYLIEFTGKIIGNVWQSGVAFLNII